MARALDVLGERWTLLIVRDLLLGPRRYGELLERLEGITTNLLAKRLREMTLSGIVQKVRAPAPASGEVYELTEAGSSLEPVIMELGRWGGSLLRHPRRSDRRDLGWALLSLKRRYTGALDAIVEIAAGPRRFELTFTSGSLRVLERPTDRAVVTASGADAGPFFALLFGGVTLESLEKSGAITLRGDHRTWRAALGALRTAGKDLGPVDASARVR